MKNNKGITLVELIVTVALLFLVIPIFWYYINMSIEDNSTLNDKVAVQSSVNLVMNQLQVDIQEARNPINPNAVGGKYTDIEAEGELEGYLICKPEKSSVLYKFDEDKAKIKVIYNLKLTVVDDKITKVEETSNTYFSEYDYIASISLDKVGENGMKVSVRGKISDKSNYELTNTYYTRNTMF